MVARTVTPAVPCISVIVVSDYAAGGEGEWTDLRKCLAALAAQDLPDQVEFILCESEELRGRLPDDLGAILPSLKILFVPADSAYALRNAAVEAASTELVALLDADCVPRSDWLRLLFDALRTHPEAAVVSGKTTYGGTSLLVRASALLARAYLDPGSAGPTRYLAENNAGYRRSAYLAHPFPTHTGTFSAHVQAEEMRRGGCTLWFDPAIGVEHDFEGWSMELDILRSRGHGTVKTRLLVGDLSYAWLVRLGPVAIPAVAMGKIVNSWRECLRCWRSYGIRWYELPLVLAAAVGMGLLEAPGMWAAYRGTGVGETCFR
jgi:hypothetical protein